jgi:hypothetical protein
MTDDDHILDPELADMGEHLLRSRPVPAAAFRGDLRRRLMADRGPRRPQRLWLRVAATSGSGLVLLAVAAIGVLGAGPLAS